MRTINQDTQSTQLRQTTIKEFMTAKILTPLLKLKVLIRIETKLLKTSNMDKFFDIIERVSKLSVTITNQLSNNLRDYCFNLYTRHMYKNISMKQFNNALNRLVNL